MQRSVRPRRPILAEGAVEQKWRATHVCKGSADAEIELQSWTKHREMLRNEIIKLARNCGWQPTDRQMADPNSVPSEYQTKKMEERGWQAFDALSGVSP